jgi:hypothetical protein
MQSLKDLHTFEGVSAFKDKPALKGVSTLKGKKLRTQVKAEASVKDTQHKVSIERAGVCLQYMYVHMYMYICMYIKT